MGGGKIKQGADHLVGHTGQEPRRLNPASAAFQPFLGNHATAKQGRFENIQSPASLLDLIAQGIQRRRRQLRTQAIAINNIF
jgi:hypothetical protein